jgi:type III secretion system FlhB-like substrate exporter
MVASFFCPAAFFDQHENVTEEKSLISPPISDVADQVAKVATENKIPSQSSKVLVDHMVTVLDEAVFCKALTSFAEQV